MKWSEGNLYQHILDRLDYLYQDEVSKAAKKLREKELKYALQKDKSQRGGGYSEDSSIANENSSAAGGTGSYDDERSSESEKGPSLGREIPYEAQPNFMGSKEKADFHEYEKQKNQTNGSQAQSPSRNVYKILNTA